MVSWAFFTVKKNDKIQVHIFGGGRVSDGVVSLFHGNKNNNKVHVHIFGGGRVPDGVVSLIAVKKNRQITCSHLWSKNNQYFSRRKFFA